MKCQLLFGLAFSLAISTLGCGSSGKGTIPVTGKVTFAGGPPPAKGTITFMPTSGPEGLPKRPGTAVFDESGAFQTTSFKPNDGLIPGTYAVRIDCWKETPSTSDPEARERLNYVPKSYQPPEVTVEVGGPVLDLKFDVPKKN
jgi:hypothetical protein